MKPLSRRARRALGRELRELSTNWPATARVLKARPYFNVILWAPDRIALKAVSRKLAATGLLVTRIERGRRWLRAVWYLGVGQRIEGTPDLSALSTMLDLVIRHADARGVRFGGCGAAEGGRSPPASAT